jgi:hypothetical protein
MPKTDSLAWTSLALSAVIVLCALLLGIRQWWEHRTRDTGLAEPERTYFFRQDFRRAVGIILMGMLALGVYVGSRLPTFVTEPRPPAEHSVDPAVGAAIPPAVGVHPSRRFLAVWLAVFAIIVLLLGLAMIDWISTRRYARRQRRAMSLERLDILRETFRRPDPAQNGPPDEVAQEPP